MLKRRGFLGALRSACLHYPVRAAAFGYLQLLGLDYLVDSDGHPWLLEVNGTPSLAVAHHDPAVEQLIQEAKVGKQRLHSVRGK